MIKNKQTDNYRLTDMLPRKPMLSSAANIRIHVGNCLSLILSSSVSMEVTQEEQI